MTTSAVPLEQHFSSSQGQKVTRRRLGHQRLIAGVVVVLVSGLLIFCAYAASWLLEPNSYAAVRSIEREPSYRDPRLMAAAWHLPVAQRYDRPRYEYQENQSFCGPASIANLLHSIGVMRSQNGVIDGTRYQPLFGILLGGLTLDQLADLLRQRSAGPVQVERGLSLVQFRQELGRVNDPARRYIVNFHRGPLFGRGHGHFSPILGYLATRDLVLVGNVNARYRSYLVSSERLWRAVDTVDPANGRKRGLLELTLAHAAPRGSSIVPSPTTSSRAVR